MENNNICNRSDGFGYELRLYNRSFLVASNNMHSNQYQAGKLKLDPINHKVSIGRRVVHLTTKEFMLLEYFLKNKDTVLPRKNIIQDVWGVGYNISSNVIDVHIKNLRKKVQSRNSVMIDTIRAAGYRLRKC